MFQSIINAIRESLQPQNMWHTAVDFVKDNPELTLEALKEATEKTKEMLKKKC